MTSICEQLADDVDAVGPNPAGIVLWQQIELVETIDPAGELPTIVRSHSVDNCIVLGEPSLKHMRPAPEPRANIRGDK